MSEKFKSISIPPSILGQLPQLFPRTLDDQPRTRPVIDQSSLIENMSQFVEGVNKGLLQTLINAHAKPRMNAPDNLVLAGPTSQITYLPTNHLMNTYYQDGDYGFYLLHPTPQADHQILVAGCSFSALSSFRHSNSSNQRITEISLNPSAPIIIQLQARKSYDDHIQTIERSFHWDRVFIELMMLWSRQAGQHRLYIQPAEENRWYHTGNSEEEIFNKQKRLELRYNGTAKKMGFTKTKSGLYYTLL